MSARPSRRRKPPAPLLLPSERRAAQEQSHAQAGGNPAAAPNHTPHTAARQPQARTLPDHDAAALTPAALPALPLGQGVRLVARHPCGLYVLDKPEGVLSHPNRRSEETRSLLTAPYSLEQECYLLPIAEPPQAAQMQEPSPSQQIGQVQESEFPLSQQTTQVREPSLPQQTAQAQEPRQTQSSPAQAAKAQPAQGQTRPLYLLHRLDSATSGLLLLADNAELAEQVRAAFATAGVRKSYLALCGGAARTRAGDKGSWSDRLQRERSGGGDIIHVRAGQGSAARTDYRCRSTDPRTRTLALMELHPVSGRTHQLRVHCAQHGLPIIGDGKYGDFRLNRAVSQATGLKRLFLHAARLSLSFDFKGRQIRLDLESPLPPAFEALLASAHLLPKAAATAGVKSSASAATGNKPMRSRGAAHAAGSRPTKKSAPQKPQRRRKG